jgi:hypothetical protein
MVPADVSDAHTTMYAGIIKKHDGGQIWLPASRKSKASVAKTNGGRPKNKSRSDEPTFPTVTQTVARDLGVDSEATIRHRVARTVKAAGLNGVTIDRSEWRR